MRQCPLCATPYDDEVEFCPLDGRVLLAADDLLGKVVGGKYRIESIAGTGGQGTVYRALHMRLERAVALKVVRAGNVEREQALARFDREARAIAQIRHPYIVTIYDFDVDPDAGAFLVMEFLEGRSLHAELRQRGRLPVDDAIAYMLQACAGVHAAHLQGLVHRDLKPENIFVESRTDGAPSIKVLDFGVAKMRRAMASDGVAESEPGDGPPSLAGTVMGTPAYMAPEQCKGRPVDARADVYALGGILYEMVVGQPPFGRGDVVDLMYSHCYDPPPVASERERSVPPAIDIVVRRALAKRPEDRYQSADELREALAAVWRPPLGVVEHTARSEDSPAIDTTGLATFAGDAILDADQTTFSGHRVRHNIPAAVNTFVGRTVEAGAIKRLLESNRLVTLTGPSGCGKTRLAFHAANEAIPVFRDGVWLVEFAALSDPALVPQAIADVIGVREMPGRSLADQLRESLATKRLLLVFDNCEHLLGAISSVVAVILRGCPHVRMIATSQQTLAVAGEVTWAVPGLDVPDTDEGVDVESVVKSEAVRLFTERAFACNPSFELTPENVRPVVRICRQLDGIPLAIELAAARVRMLPVEQIAERLEDRFRLLTTGDRTAQPRQRTLQAAMDWSFDLLDDAERLVFTRLSVFAGGFSIEAAEDVCYGDSLGREDVFDAIGLLVDKSLVNVIYREGTSRYAMLNTVRHYGALRLQSSGTAPHTRTKHRNYFLALAERVGAALRGPDAGARLDMLEVEHDNLRAALEWSQTDAKESDAFIRCASALQAFWAIRGHVTEGVDWLERSLTIRDCASAPALANALLGVGHLERLLGRYDDARERLDESLGLFRKIGDLGGIANALANLGAVAERGGDYDRALELHAESLEAARAADDKWEAASALNNLGVVARYRGDVAESVVRFWESLALFRELGDEREVANALNNLGVLAGTGGDVDECERLLQEALTIRRRMGDRFGIANSLVNLGEVSRMKRDYANALKYLHESVTLHLKMDDLRGVAYALEGFVEVAVGLSLAEDALRLAGASSALRRKLGAPLSPSEQADLGAHIDRARKALPESRGDEMFEAGRGLSLRRALEIARSLAIVPDVSGVTTEAEP